MARLNSLLKTYTEYLVTAAAALAVSAGLFFIGGLFRAGSAIASLVLILTVLTVVIVFGLALAYIPMRLLIVHIAFRIIQFIKLERERRHIRTTIEEDQKQWWQ